MLIRFSHQFFNKISFCPLENIDLSTLSISSVMLKAYVLSNKQTNTQTKNPNKIVPSPLYIAILE